MKKSLTLWILLGAVLLLSIAALAVSLLGNGTQAGEDGQETDQADSYLFLVERDSDEIRAIDYIYKGASPVSLVKTNRWTLLKNDTLPVNQEKINTLAAALATVAVQRKLVDSADDYAQYGLKEPSTQVTVTYQDGGQITFYLGNENPRQEGTSYLKTSQSEAVYLVSSTMTTFFAYSWDQLLDLDVIPEIDVADMQAIHVENPRGTGIELTRIPAENETDTAKKWKAVYASGEENILSSSNLAGDLLACVIALPLNEPVWCADVTDDIRTQYGMDAEHATKVTVKYTVTTTASAGDSSSPVTTTTEKSLSLLIGADATVEADGDNRYVYLMMEESSYIYRCLISESEDLLADFAPKTAEETTAETVGETSEETAEPPPAETVAETAAQTNPETADASAA